MVSYCLCEKWTNSLVQIGDLNADFDRCTSIDIDRGAVPKELQALWASSRFQNPHPQAPLQAREAHQPISVSLDELRDLLPTLVPLATNCIWEQKTNHNELTQVLLNALVNAPAFRIVSVQLEDRASCAFVTRQVELGNVAELRLQRKSENSSPRPPAKLAETLRTFVNSPRFHKLTYYGELLPCDFELFERFLERALAGELKREARCKFGNVNFEKCLLSALRPECREESKEIAWKSPNSKNRVVLDRSGRCMTVM